MRISANKISPDYRPDYMGAAIYLDGELVDRVIAVDDIAGEVILTSLNELGDMYLVGGEIATEVLKGAVRIVKHGSWRCAESIGFDAWMRERTEAAHQAMIRTPSAVHYLSMAKLHNLKPRITAAPTRITTMTPSTWRKEY